MQNEGKSQTIRNLVEKEVDNPFPSDKSERSDGPMDHDQRKKKVKQTKEDIAKRKKMPRGQSQGVKITVKPLKHQETKSIMKKKTGATSVPGELDKHRKTVSLKL